MTLMSAIPAIFPFRCARGLSQAVGLALAIASAPALGLGLGDIELRSQLGQPFQADVPVRLADGEVLTSSCVNVQRGDGAEIPGIGSATVKVESRGGRTFLVVRGRGPFNEPIARLVVEAGCDTRVTREFVLFIDPPELALPGGLAGGAARGAVTTPSVASQAAAAPAPERRARVEPRRPAPPRMRVAPVPAAGAAVPAATAIDKSTVGPARGSVAPRPAGDRLRMVSPEDALPIGGGQAPSDRLAAAEAARVAAEARLVAREQELAAQLVALGKEIEELKTRAALHVDHASAVADDQLPPWWAFALAAAALLAVAASFGLYRRQRELTQMLRGMPWGQGGAEANTPVASAADPVVTAAASPLAAYDSETDPRYVESLPDLARRAAPVEVNFPDRLGDIEVEELNGTRALNALRTEPEAVPRGVVTRSAVLDLPDEDFALGATQGQPALQASSVFDAAQLPPLDFDLGMPEGEEPLGAGFGATATLPALRSLPAVPASTRAPLGAAEARRIQARLRATVDAVEQADNYVENGQFESAAVTLGRYIEEHPDAPRAAWLMLLELYRRTDRTPAYETLASGFVDRFGRPARPWDQAGSLDRGVGLDSNPEMLQSIWAKWGTPEAIGLLADLLEDPDASDADYYNLALQRDLLNFVKICPLDA